MAISNILLPVDGSDESKGILLVALEFARRHEAHLDVLHVQIDSRDVLPLLGEGMSVAMIEDMIELAEHESNKRCLRARKIFDDAVSKHDVNIVQTASKGGFSVRWIMENGREDEVIRKYSRLTDLVILPRRAQSVDISSNLKLHVALFESGRAVLMLPPNCSSNIGRRPVVSWNGSLQAARSVKLALPLLSVAESVHVFTIENEQNTKYNAKDLQDYLGWHGIECKTSLVTGSPSKVGSRLHDFLLDSDRDLLVMGAYTQSRMRQLIIGGVTRYIMENAEYPVFMAH